jgi:hypothetical protein
MLAALVGHGRKACRFSRALQGLTIKQASF